MSAPDWLLPARSIPVQPGYHVIDVRDGMRGVFVALVDGWATVCVTDGDRSGEVEDCPPRDLAPDLSNPDTFAAARDRLALACGMDRSDGGTAFLPLKQDAGWVLWSIWAGVEAEWATPKMFPDIPKDASRELALALAWQKVVGA